MIRTKGVQKKSYWSMGYLVQYNKAILFRPFDSLEELLNSDDIIDEYYHIFRVTSTGDVYIRYKRRNYKWQILSPSVEWVQTESCPIGINCVK